MAELLEETEFASVATLEQPDGEPIEPCNPETLLTDLPKGGTLDYFDSALTHHTCVALNEFVTMHADQDIAQSVKTRLLDSFDFDPEQRRKISIYSYLGWVGEMHDKISTLPRATAADNMMDILRPHINHIPIWRREWIKWIERCRRKIKGCEDAGLRWGRWKKRGSCYNHSSPDSDTAKCPGCSGAKSVGSSHRVSRRCQAGTWIIQYCFCAILPRT